MNNKLAILQNFIVTKSERLDTLRKVLPTQTEIFNNCNWYVNYNTDYFFDDVHSLFKNNVKNLTFYNDLTKDYGRIIQSMIQDIKEDYVFIIPPEDCMIINTKEYINNLIDEFVNHDCQFMQMTRIHDIKCYGTDKKYFKHYDTKEFLHLVNSDNWTTQTLSSVSIFKKTFLNEALKYFNLNKNTNTRFKRATPHSFEYFFQRSGGEWPNGTDMFLKNKLFALPKQGILQHYEPISNGVVVKEVN